MRDVARTLKVFQQGFNYSQDGRGNRLVLHLQGCNMHCPWCSNPEGMPVRGALMTEKEWLTENCCPKGAVRNGSLDRSVLTVFYGRIRDCLPGFIGERIAQTDGRNVAQLY